MLTEDIISFCLLSNDSMCLKCVVFFFYCNLNTEILEMCCIDAKQDIRMKSLSYTELDCVSVRWYVPHNNDKRISIKAK